MEFQYSDDVFTLGMVGEPADIAAVAMAILPAHCAVISKLDQILQNQEKQMADLTQITANVATNTTVIGSAVTLLGNLKTALDAAGTDPVKLKALSDQLGANDDALAAAVAANTPAAPEAPAV